MKLKHKPNGESLAAVIERVENLDYLKIEQDNSFSFDWQREKKYEVYKIVLQADEDIILGLISLIDIPEEYRIHLNLLEITKPQQGKDKTIESIAGCLIAFAAKKSFERKYFGFVSLEPKTALISHYQDKYGFESLGMYLKIEGATARAIIQKYLENE